jgi:FkbM family methyltransferase
MKLINLLAPEFLFNPRQIFHRLAREWWQKPALIETVWLPWRLPLRIRPHETIGCHIWLRGVFDLVVSETIWRLTEPNELAVDVGANIGYITSILARRAGSSGVVVAMEPFPEVFQDLKANTLLWQEHGAIAEVRAVQIALGSQSGTAILHLPSQEECNRGLASLRRIPGSQAVPIQTPVTTLDEFFQDDPPIGVLKIDVEGFEREVLLGADRLLKKRRVRDIIFEESHPYPSPVTEQLRSLGYELFGLNSSRFGLRLESAGHRQPGLHDTEVPSYLATVNPQRAKTKLSQLGWRCLCGCV